MSLSVNRARRQRKNQCLLILRSPLPSSSRLGHGLQGGNRENSIPQHQIIRLIILDIRFYDISRRSQPWALPPGRMSISTSAVSDSGSNHESDGLHFLIIVPPDSTFTIPPSTDLLVACEVPYSLFNGELLKILDPESLMEDADGLHSTFASPPEDSFVPMAGQKASDPRIWQLVGIPASLES